MVVYIEKPTNQFLQGRLPDHEYSARSGFEKE